MVQTGDKRSDIATACGNEAWAANAPAIFLVAYDSSQGGDGGILTHEWIEVDAGCVVQQLLLEASTMSLSANVVAKGLESWNGVGAGNLRNTLGLASSIIPLYVVPIGHQYVIPEFTNTTVFGLSLAIIAAVIVLFLRKNRQKVWD
jgi:hypothetical protein